VLTARAASVPEPLAFSGYEIDETKDRLVMARAKASAASDLIGGAGILVVGLAALAGLAWLFGGGLFERDHRGMLFVMVLGLVSLGFGVRSLQRAWGVYQHREILVLDRAHDAITRMGAKVGPLGDLEHVILRREEHNTSEDTVIVFKVALDVAGLRGRGAPRFEGSTLDELVPVCDSTNERDMRLCAGRLAAFAGVTIEEIGT
jgi:hypothetical protein